MDDDAAAENAPLNMRNAYLKLQQIYGEESIPLILGTEMHGGKTDMARIEVGKDQMMLCLTENYHGVPEKYTDSAPFFVLGHEFGHIVAHPGKDSAYWIEGMKEIPVEDRQKGKWLNAISDILVNWTVISGTTVITEQEKEAMKKAMLDGWRSSQFTRRCNTKQGILRHKKLLSESKGGKPLKDNRYQPNGGLRGQYDEPLNPTTKYEPSALTPFYQKHMGHGRGEQYYPPINYCVAKKMPERWRKVVALKGGDGVTKGKTYIVEGTKTYDGRENTEDYEPISEFLIKGKWISARFFQSSCPDCGSPCRNIWDNWWHYKPKADRLQDIEAGGTWQYLVIQMFAFEWAMAYSSFIPLGKRAINREAGEVFLGLIADDMDALMRGY